MKNRVRLKIDGIGPNNRRKLLDALRGMGLQEINSVHDDSEDKHRYEFTLEGELNPVLITEEEGIGQW